MRPLLHPTSLLVLGCALLAPSAAAAGPAEDAALRLFRGEIEPEAAARAWKAARLDPDEALALVRALPLEEAPAGDHQTTLTDPYGRETELVVRFPEDGPRADGRYGVMILLHGLGGNSLQGVAIGQALAPPHTIVAAPTAQRPPASEEPEDLRLARLAKIPVLKEFPHWWSYGARAFPLLALDYLKRRYPLDTDRVVLVGYSMGGFGTWNLGLRFHELFAGLAPMAGGIAREEFVLGRDRTSRALLDNAAMVPCFFVHGSEDEVVPVRMDRWTAEDLRERGIEFVYEEVAGGAHKLDEVLDPTHPLVARIAAWLSERTRDPHPERVVHRAIGDYHPGAFWLQIDGFAAATAVVRGAVVGRNKIAIHTEGVSRLTVFLDPELVRTRRKVGIAVDDRLVFAQRVPASLLAVAASFARTRDPQLVYMHAVTLEVEPRAAEGDEEGEGAAGDWSDWLNGRR